MEADGTGEPKHAFAVCSHQDGLPPASPTDRSRLLLRADRANLGPKQQKYICSWKKNTKLASCLEFHVLHTSSAELS